MPDPAPKPPDLDVYGNPIGTGKPPDLDIYGQPAGSAPLQPGTTVSVNPLTALGIGGLATAGALRYGVPAAANAILNFATNPTAPLTGSAIGRVVGGVAPTVSELASGNIPAAAYALGTAGKTAWAGGRAGFYTAKFLRDSAANALDKVPYLSEAVEAAGPLAEAVSTPLAGASGGAMLAAPWFDDPQVRAAIASHVQAGADALHATGSYWDALKAYFSGQATLQTLSKGQ
jgi:hypothetical protein